MRVDDKTQSEQIMQIMRDEYAVHDEANEEEIDPAMLAAFVQKRLDPDDKTPTLIAYAAVLQLRQMARGICRRISPTDQPTISTQVELFDGQLQRRYPATRNSREVYVIRSRLTLDERNSIEARMRAASISLARHVDAFHAETESLIAAGAFEVASAA